MSRQSIGKQVCPTCGQSVNKRLIPFHRGMVTALWRAYQWCEQNNTNEFTKKQVKHLFDDVMSSTFAYWRWFGGLVYNPSGVKGHYGLNMQRCEEYFAGKLEIPTVVFVDALTREITTSHMATINGVPTLKRFMDENDNYVARYKK